MCKIRNLKLMSILHDNRGITMVEILVAGGILMLISMGVIQGFSFAAKTVALTDKTIAANAVLVRELEMIKSMGSTVSSTAYQQSASDPLYGSEREVFDNQPQNGMMKITVKVYEHPKAPSSTPLTELSIYIRKDGSGI